MSDREMRRILLEVLWDVEAGRLRLPRAARLLRRAVLPAVLGASLGLAACDSEPVGRAGDAAVLDARSPDAGPQADAAADLDASTVQDADPCPNCVYMAPPPIEP